MSLPVGEDDHSIHRHIQWMKQEARARKPDRSKMSLLMKLTFSTRREMVTSGGATVKEVLDEYPWLANEDEICAEYSRLTETNIADKVNSGLGKVSERIYYLIRNSSKVEDDIKALMKDVDKSTDGYCTNVAVHPIGP
ncbi:uncharacterized protein LOC124292102 [Haliotis rubra]|uniref:uncharacterized protein LOC124292102 n=1 Tax=Haliotis rubra TaxID=36100 RepID=UPI001EE60065|nr:uncharacterized protein LOC124292102 [Haliotis rubra]